MRKIAAHWIVLLFGCLLLASCTDAPSGSAAAPGAMSQFQDSGGDSGGGMGSGGSGGY
jgi:hypothetical protein